MNLHTVPAVLIAAVLGSGCGDNGTQALPDAGTADASGDATELDAFVDPILRVSVKLEDLMTSLAPDVRSTYGAASATTPFDTGGTSWRFQKPSTGSTAEKFELYVPFGVADANTPPELAAIRAHLGAVTIADIASIKVHTRRTTASGANDFAVIAYSKPDGTDDDASWYGRRLHASLEWAASLDAPADTWNEFASDTGTNQIQFWDFRNANLAAGIQPADNYFTLAAMQAGPVTPAGVTGARDYRTEELLFLSFSTFSDVTTFDGAIDGIELVLTSGKGIALDLAGDADWRHAKVSLERLRADHAVGNSYGVATTASTTSPFAGASSWNYVKDGTSPSAEKLELHLPFAATATSTVNPLWDGIRAHLGALSIADVASITVRSRKSASATTDFTLLVYTLPDGTDDDASWYGRRLHVPLESSGALAAPTETWNEFSTAAGANQLQFWDYRHPNLSLGEQPTDNRFTLAAMQAGPVTPAGVTGARDYRTERIQYITLSTYSDYATFDGSLDGIEIELTSGKRLVLDLEQ
jgi:hypothetical protein